MNRKLGRGRQIGDDVEGANVLAFHKETAQRTGRSERDVRRDADRGGKIAEDVLSRTSWVGHKGWPSS